MKRTAIKQRFIDLVYDLEKLALSCSPCEGTGTIWPNNQARVCKICEPLLAVIRTHKRHDSMGLNTAAGSKVVFHNPRNGYHGDIKTARAALKLGQEYTVAGMEVHSCSSTVELLEFPKAKFNTVQFVNVPVKP